MTTPRVALVVPASSARMVDKALGLDVDEVVLDLEDAVVPGEKNRARQRVVDVLAGTPRALAVRVNQVGSPWCHLDVQAVVGAARGPVVLVVPKVDGPGDLAFVDRLVRGCLARATDGGPEVVLDALVESASGLRRVDRVATSSDLLRALVIGYADLAADLGRAPGDDPTTWDTVRQQVVTAGRAAGLGVLDGPHLSTAVDDTLVADKRRAHALGLDGSWVIHPGQVDTVRAVFSPSPDQLAWARRVVDALADSARCGAGAVAVDGLMVDEAVAVRARAVLATGERG